MTSLPVGTWMSTRSLSSTLQFSNLLLHPIPRLPVKSWLLFPKPKLVGEERAGLWDGNSSRTSPAEPLLGCLLMQSANLEKKIIFFFLFSSPYNVNVLQDNSHQSFFCEMLPYFCSDSMENGMKNTNLTEGTNFSSLAFVISVWAKL